MSSRGHRSQVRRSALVEGPPTECAVATRESKTAGDFETATPVKSSYCKNALQEAANDPRVRGVAVRYESRVRKYRVRKGLSQEELADRLGVSRQTIANIERGLNEPRVLLALALAAVLGVAISELFRKGPK